MSTPKNDGGPAFPGPSDYNSDGSPVWAGARGMTLRDWFAGQALAGIAIHDIDNDEGWPDYANAAYRAADAMLAAREGKV